jgi:hypothetical protein
VPRLSYLAHGDEEALTKTLLKLEEKGIELKLPTEKGG